MTAQSTDIYSGDLRHQDLDEIDLRRYLLVLLKWWREILVISILAGAITGLVIMLLNTNATPVYSATADLVIASWSSNIELDERVSTSTGAAQVDVNGWRTSLVQLADSSALAALVLDELNDELPTELRSPQALADVVEASIPLSADERYASNIIRISATTASPEISAKIANSWSLHLVDYINGLYGEVPESTIESVTEERDQALSNYQDAQKAIDDFVADNQIDVLTRQIQEKTTLRDGIMLNYMSMLTSVVTTEYTAKLSLYSLLANSSVARTTALIAAQSAGNAQSLTSHYDLHTSAVGQLNQARNMQRTLVDGGAAAAKSNSAALQLLKLSALAALQGNDRLPVNLSMLDQTQAIEMSLEEQLVDVGTLVTVLEEYVVQLEDDIQQLEESEMMGASLPSAQNQATNDGSSAAIATTATTTTYTNTANAYAQLLTSSGIVDQMSVDINSLGSDAHEMQLARLESEIRTLQSQLSSENARNQQLTHQRDLAWTTYDAVGNKLQELSLLRSASNSEVRMGNPALVPQTALPLRNPLLPVVALTLLGFFAAIILALLVDSLGGEPFFMRRSTGFPITQ